MRKLEEVEIIFDKQAMPAIYRWSKPIYKVLLGISAIAMATSLLSLSVTLVTKTLIDDATEGKDDAMWFWGSILTALIIVQRLLTVWTSMIRV